MRFPGMKTYNLAENSNFYLVGTLAKNSYKSNIVTLNANPFVCLQSMLTWLHCRTPDRCWNTLAACTSVGLTFQNSSTPRPMNPTWQQEQVSKCTVCQLTTKGRMQVEGCLGNVWTSLRIWQLCAQSRTIVAMVQWVFCLIQSGHHWTSLARVNALLK